MMNKNDLPIDFYHAPAVGKSRGGIILCQEIFGVTEDLCKMADQYASSGFEVIVPAFFDRVEKNFIFSYTGDYKHPMSIVSKLGWEQPVADAGLCARFLNEKRGQKSVAILGYCWGGSLAWLAACRLPKGRIQAAICYYGSQIYNARSEKPTCPVIFHFGLDDKNITQEHVQGLREAHPELPVHVYEGAGHGFANEGRESYRSDAAQLSTQRNLEFLTTNL